MTVTKVFVASWSVPPSGKRYAKGSVCALLHIWYTSLRALNHSEPPKTEKGNGAQLYVLASLGLLQLIVAPWGIRRYHQVFPLSFLPACRLPTFPHETIFRQTMPAGFRCFGYGHTHFVCGCLQQCMSVSAGPYLCAHAHTHTPLLTAAPPLFTMPLVSLPVPLVP